VHTACKKIIREGEGSGKLREVRREAGMFEGKASLFHPHPTIDKL